MKTEFLGITPVFPSRAISRDLHWYEKYVGFETLHSDEMYAVKRRDHLSIHLQWHADTEDDPLLGGSVVKIFVKDLKPIFEELIGRGTIEQDKLRPDTDWNTHEFGFYDLNNNAIFFVEAL